MDMVASTLYDAGTVCNWHSTYRYLLGECGIELDYVAVYCWGSNLVLSLLRILFNYLQLLDYVYILLFNQFLIALCLNNIICKTFLNRKAFNILFYIIIIISNNTLKDGLNK